MKKNFPNKFHGLGITEESARSLSKFEIISIGMGWYYTLFGALILFVSILIISTGIDAIIYSFKKEPIEINNKINLDKLKHNDYVKVNLQLDYTNGLILEKIGKQFLLTPFMDTKNKLFLYEEGPVVINENKIEKTSYSGRLVGKDFSDEWDLGSNRVKMIDGFKKIGVDINYDALVLEQIEPGMPHPWLMFISFVSFLVILFFIIKLINTVKLLGSNKLLAEYLVKHMHDKET